MEDKNKSQKLLGEETQESSDDSLPIQESLELNSEQKKELDLRIGTYEEAEKIIFLVDGKEGVNPLFKIMNISKEAIYLIVLRLKKLLKVF